MLADSERILAEVADCEKLHRLIDEQSSHYLRRVVRIIDGHIEQLREDRLNWKDVKVTHDSGHACSYDAYTDIAVSINRELRRRERDQAGMAMMVAELSLLFGCPPYYTGHPEHNLHWQHDNCPRLPEFTHYNPLVQISFPVDGGLGEGGFTMIYVDEDHGGVLDQVTEIAAKYGVLVQQWAIHHP
jgi:hypothetical protein